MKPHCFWLSALVLLSACSPVLNPTPARPTVPPTPALDDLAPYRAALLPAYAKDIDQLDRPTRYTVSLAYDDAKPTLSGTEDVRYFNRQTVPLNEIYFRLFANYPDSGGKITVDQVLVDGTAIAPVLQVQDTALKVPLSKPLAPGAGISIQLTLTATIPRNSRGHYADFTAYDTVTTMPSALPLIPAYDAKGWHIELPPGYGDLVYADVSLYLVTITVPSKMNVIASGSTIDTKDNGNGTSTWRIAGAPMRDFDINVTDRLQHVSTSIGDVTLNSWYESADTTAGANALKYASDAFRSFQTHFGAYPYKELDVVETPTTAGGIEYPGVIVVANSLYRGTNPGQREFFEFATAHEVAHQWWYGLVGDDQVNAPWVDEATAQYSTLVYWEDVHGQAAAQAVVRQQFQGPYDRAKSQGHDAAVNQPVSAFDEADYSAIVYGKGPLFYDAIRKAMGNDKFFQFLQAYYSQFRYKIAAPEDILKTAETTCGCSLQDEYKQWILTPAK